MEDRERWGTDLPPSTEEVWIRGPAGMLEGSLHTPQGIGACPGVLMLSPHPRYGGDLKNNVTRGMARALTARGFAVLRFNYRGVGRSQSPFADPLASFRWWSEVLERDAYGPVLEDARAAARWLAELAHPIHAVGYSFGAVLALRLAAEEVDGGGEALASATLVAMAVGDYRLDFLSRVRIPILALHGDRDFATPFDLLQEKLGLLAGPHGLELLPETDHFFRGKEEELGARAARFFGVAKSSREARR